MELLRVLIVGCGNIAGTFDQGRAGNELPYTHAGAFLRDGRFILSACVEPDTEKRKAFMAAWGINNGYSSLEQVAETEDGFDVISICSPTPMHAQNLELALKLKPRLIFCEKPVTTSLTESERLVAACRDANILLAVNHTRRWAPDVAEFQADMRTGRWGQLRSVVGFYNKGILNNGSHLIDLLHLLLGKMEIEKVGEPLHDFFPNDPTVPVWLKAAQGVPVHLVCGNAADYALFEIQMIFSKGMVTMEDGGFFWRERRAVASNAFKGYQVLGEGVRRDGEYRLAMQNAADNIFRAITSGAALASTGETAIATQRVCEEIARLACTNPEKVRVHSTGEKSV
ncbi:MAG: Gfo/Idh/MocA family oxidoreductase [Gammaproteobacteria bacterium]|nr:Gfo/Idh/MocA family oxidoreductase [Gammaproteobacteria bacterium]MBU1624025.1 Gfo/Idh/MocA family oxidoreductase [Gammaproteobacteria bacterium]MBU1981753.1 Gfo/Idh/MocA family oxidoreductase [Gammaproteobacteria bacterium]